MRLGAGRLDRRITLLQPGPELADDTGEARAAADIEHEVWAASAEVSAGQEEIEGDTLVASRLRRYWLRQADAPGLDESWRVRDGGADEIFSVVSIGRGQQGDGLAVVLAERRR